MKEITVTHRIIDDTPVVFVPIENSDKEVKLYQDDFNYLVRHGIDLRWKLVNGQIMERGTRLSITRLVANAGAKQKVSLRDGNPLNLMRGNLLIGPGGGRFNPKDRLLNYEERPHKLNKPTINHQYINPKVLQQL
jgi:hypothetical protein